MNLGPSKLAVVQVMPAFEGRQAVAKAIGFRTRSRSTATLIFNKISC